VRGGEDSGLAAGRDSGRAGMGGRDLGPSASGTCWPEQDAGPGGPGAPGPARPGCGSGYQQ